ncbi:MAG: hypothetical protein KJ737_07310, partial [Proteobacteria bacterium]|nr:hypothetical protein [Pseudomonadota bacterium]
MTRREFYIMVLLIIIIFLIDKNHSLAQEILGSVDIHGFISQGYLKSDNNNFLSETEDGSFQFNEMGINFNTSLTDDLRLGIQFFSRDLGKNGNDEVVVDWALADYHFRDWMGLRVGKMKIPINLYNESRDIDMLRTQVLLPQSVYAELYRDIYATQKGFCLYGDIMIGYMGRIAYT